MLVDGYNVIHAWPELKELTDGNLDGARINLMETLSNYQAIRKCQIIVVFDAHLQKGHPEEMVSYQNIYMVFTKEALTADLYIEKFAHDNQKRYSITVVTSDRLQQNMVRGSGSYLLSARELKYEIEMAIEKIKEEHLEKQDKERNYFVHTLNVDTRRRFFPDDEDD
jgi:predicted RNA-binding protein with PIN domain